MPLGMLSNTPPIGIDFGVGSLKALQLTEGERPQIIAAAAIEVPVELAFDHEARLAYQFDALPSLLKGAGFKGKRAAISVSSVLTFVKHFQAPRQDGQPLAPIVRAQLQAQTGCDLSRIVCRFVEVQGAASGSGRAEVICLAMSRELVVRHMRALKKLRLDTVGVHSEHIALAKAYERFSRATSEDPNATILLDLGAGTTNVIIAHAGHMVFAKTIQIGAASFDRAASEQYRCDIKEAHTRRLALASRTGAPVAAGPVAAGPVAEAKPEPAPAHAAPERLTGIPALDAELSRDSHAGGALAVRKQPAARPAPAPAARPSDSAPDLREQTESLTDEIASCVRYHARVFPDKMVTRTIFVGGASADAALCRAIAQSLRTPAQIADPLSSIGREGAALRNVDFSKPAPAWATTLGLCLCAEEE